MTPAPAVTYAHASPIVEYVTGDMLAFVQRQVAPTEFEEVVEIGESLPTESASPIFVTAPVFLSIRFLSLST